MTAQQDQKSPASFDIEPATPVEPPVSMRAPLPLDSFVHGIDPLDGLVVFSLSEGSVYAAWIRPDSGFTADDVAAIMREAYRTGLQASRRLAAFSPGGDRGPAAEPLVTIETLARTAILKRVRAFIIATLFDASIPLGMARLCAARLTFALEPELPLTELERLTLPPVPNVLAPPPRFTGQAAAAARRSVIPLKAPHASPAEADRARRLIAYAEANLPDAHTVRLRLALRAHTSRLSLDHPEALPSEAILRIETAVLEMLGIERDQLTAVLTDSLRP